MTTSHDRVSATIYEFPARGRFAQAGQGNEKSSANYLSSRVTRVAYGSGCWYHDEAIEDAEHTRRN
jgi:hypothetical protein